MKHSRINEIEVMSDAALRIAAYQALLATQPQDAYAWSNLAVDQLAQGNRTGARRSMLAALAVHERVASHASFPDAVAPLLAIGAYRLTHEVFADASHAIYEAIHTATTTRVWLRCLLDCSHETASALFRDHEARTRAELPQLARGDATICDGDGRPFQVLEPLERATLHELIFERKLAPDAATRLIGEIAEAVIALRRRGLTTIDLRPQYWARSPALERGIVYLGPALPRGNYHWAGATEDVEMFGLLLYAATTGSSPPPRGIDGRRSLAGVRDDHQRRLWPEHFKIIERCFETVPERRPSLAQIAELARAAAEHRRPAIESGGRSVGGYTLLRVIGSGGFGTVYEATNAAGERRAVKILHPHLAAHRELLLRFKTEAHLAGEIAHPNIVGSHDVGETDAGEHYYVMELVTGGSIADRIRRGPMDPRSVAAIGIQVADGLAELHARGVFHRDLKPSNLLVAAERGADITVKVCDFGVAKFLVEPTGFGIPATRIGFPIGTPEYMAPEQRAGTAIDARTDIFALGVVLRECLTGSRTDTGERHAGITGELARIVDRMSAPPPEHRQQSMREVMRDLQLWCEAHDRSVAQPTRYTPEPVLAPVVARPRRRRWLVAGVAAAALATTGAIALWPTPPADIDHNDPNDPKPDPKPDPRPDPVGLGHSDPALAGAAFDQAIARIGRKEPFIADDKLDATLRGLESTTLRLLRNAVYAAHGARITKPDLRAFFYGPRPNNVAALPWRECCSEDEVTRSLVAHELRLVRAIKREEAARKPSTILPSTAGLTRVEAGAITTARRVDDADSEQLATALTAGVTFASNPQAARGFAPGYLEKLREIPQLVVDLRRDLNDPRQSASNRLAAATALLYLAIDGDAVADTRPGGYGLLDDWMILSNTTATIHPERDTGAARASMQFVGSALPRASLEQVFVTAWGMQMTGAVIDPQTVTTMLPHLLATDPAHPPAVQNGAPAGAKDRYVKDHTGSIYSSGNVTQVMFEGGGSVLMVGDKLSVNPR